MDRKEQIAEGLAKGMKAVDVASIAGVSPEYISELVATDEAFKELLRDKMIEFQDQRNDEKFKRLKEKTINAISENIATAELSEQIRVLESISRIENARKHSVLPGTYANPTIGVTLVFKESSIPKLVMDEKQRIVAIGETSVMPMTSAGVRKLFADMENKGKVIEHDKQDITTVQTVEAQPSPIAAAG